MIEDVRKFMQEKQMPGEGAKIIVGLSGGADSVVLLYILKHLNYNCIAAHCNFHLRGEESMRDESFSTGFAAMLEIPFRKKDFDTRENAQKQKISIEMSARELRYQWFEELRQQEKADAIAVAHHQDDNTETLLINLIRGTGIRGLTGMKPVNGSVIRPLLCLSKKDIIDFASRNDLTSITDSTNLSDDFMRNKVRLKLLPFLRTINPSIDLSLTQTMENLAETEKIYDHSIREAIAGCFDGKKGIILLSELLQCPSPESVLFEILKKFNFSKDTILDVAKSLDKQSGKEFFSEKYRLIKDRKTLILIPTMAPEAPTEYKLEKGTDSINHPLFIALASLNYTQETIIDKNKYQAYLDEEKLTFPLILRKWMPGDRFVPFGMKKGSQKLSDYFSDHKLNLAEKENTWVICSGTDICWIVGHRTDERFRISCDTKRILKLTLNPE